MLDLMSANGLVLDGSGNDSFRAAVGSRPTRFTHFGAASGLEAKRVIDATDRVVCPGFIDMHATPGS